MNDRRSAYGFYGNDGRNEIAIELGATYGARLYVATKLENRRHANIVIEPSTYSFNGGKSGSLNIRSPYPKGAIMYVKSGYILKMYEIGLPKELASHGIKITGDGVRNLESFIDIVDTFLSEPDSPSPSVPILMPSTCRSLTKLLLVTSTTSTALLIALPRAITLT